MSEAACLDCGAELTGRFCASCGQKVEPQQESIFQLAKDAVAAAVVLDSKLWRTVSTLLFRPGALTDAYERGQRTRFIRPFKMYFWVSVVFFSLVTLESVSGFRSGDTLDAHLAAMPTSKSELGQVARKRTALFTKLGKEFQEVCTTDGTCDPEKTEALWKNYGPLFRTLMNRLPKTAFALLPVFALLLKMLWSKRPLVSHLIFALHWHTLFFINMTLSLALWAPLVHVLDVASLAWTVLAIRRFYRSSWLVTVVKTTLLLGLHVMAIALVFTVVLMVTVLFIAT